LLRIGKYQVISKLATGGMAEVFLAKAAGPRGFEKRLVLKRILPHLVEDSRFVEMFLAEARLSAQLEHPNIVHIFDFGELEGTYYLAMEYIDGSNLRALSRRAYKDGVRLPPVFCAKIISLACEGLAFAHDFTSLETGDPLNLIHRDISPDNILLSRQGAVKVVDFGIAKAANQEHTTQTGMLKGKIAYMSPEQLQGHPLDRRADVYALGVVLYELLTGQKPFDATTDMSSIQAILYEPFVPAAQRRPDLPRALGQILERALHKDREHRYPDCRAFHTELERFILSTGEPVGAFQLAQLVDAGSGQVPIPTPTPLTGAGTVEEEHAPHTPERRTGCWVVVASLALLFGGSGVVFSMTHASSKPVVLREPPPLGTSREMAPRVAVQESSPVPVLQASEPEAKPVVEPALEKPEPQPQPAPVKPASRFKGSRGVAPPEPAPAPAPRVSETATLEFRIRPYATVVFDGKQLGQTPLAPAEVEVGTHHVLLINHELGKKVARTVEVKAGQLNVFKHNLLEE
jgi:serine/threonine-protein kinase